MMSSKEIIRFWNLKDMLMEGKKAGYNYDDVKIENGEMFIKEQTK